MSEWVCAVGGGGTTIGRKREREEEEEEWKWKWGKTNEGPGSTTRIALLMLALLSYNRQQDLNSIKRHRMKIR